METLMGRNFFNCAAAAIVALGTMIGVADRANAQVSPVVVELYTSQGCSSCPPADEYLGRLADRSDVIALSLHVDYWDYLGWRDVFSSPAHTRRQRDYAGRMGERMVYTPQIVVQGREGMVGSHAKKVDAAIKRHAAQPTAALVKLVRMDDRLVAEIMPVGDEQARGQVLMAWYSRAEQVAIRAGENRGREIVYHNVVRGWSDMGVWRGGRIALTAPLPMADGVAVLIQDREGGPILGAGRLALK